MEHIEALPSIPRLNCTLSCSPHPPLHGHGTDVPPAAVQAASGLLDGVVLRVAAAGVGIVEQDVTQRQHRRHALRVLLNVPLQILPFTTAQSQSHLQFVSSGLDHKNTRLTSACFTVTNMDSFIGQRFEPTTCLEADRGSLRSS